MSRKQYKTPSTRLARVMESSRDLWKQRAAEKQHTIRSQRVTIRDLRVSRDRWKEVALEATRQLAQVRRALPVACIGGPSLGGD